MIVDKKAIEDCLANKPADYDKIRLILSKAKQLRGLSVDEAACLCSIPDDLINELFASAEYIKETIYGNRIVIFAPLYISNYCDNDCIYCAFSTSNTSIKRNYLTNEKIAEEITYVINQGHKRILLVAGESYHGKGVDYITDAITAIYNTKAGNGKIRRVNVNIAPLSVDEFKHLKAANIGTYQLFQETYHEETYHAVHRGPKQDYQWRIGAMDRAMQAGIDDVGLGILLGLYDWKFDVLALIQHAQYLEKQWGVGPHTLSVPRIEPAGGIPFSENPPFAVSDSDFKKIIAVLRCAVPYTGIILSTRETPDMRRSAMALGVSQISAGSRTNPGGYTGSDSECQFSLGDHRNLDEVVYDLATLGYISSFCTACYRLHRTGKDFMDMAKPGLIKQFCTPNAMSTYLEYLLDYASDRTRQEGMGLIQTMMAALEPSAAEQAEKLMHHVKEGKRDVMC